MRRLLMTAGLALLAAACSPSGAAQGTGSGGQRTYQVTGFDRVELAGHYDVRVTVGGTPAVMAQGDEAELERLEINVREGRLRIGSKPGSWTSRGKAVVYVTVPSLQGVEVAGSGNVEVGALRSANFHGGVAGSGNLVLQSLESDAATFDIAGSGNVRASGRTRAVKLDVAGSGNGELGQLQAETADISLAGSGNAQVRASGTAKVALVGSGNAIVAGGARCTVRKAGSGAVRCG